MTDDDISKLIQECGFPEASESTYLYFWRFYKKAYEAGAKAEREACAKLCRILTKTYECHAAIRARDAE